MIVARLVGGLGNQLFQYAAGRSLALRRQTELALDSSWIDGDGGAGLDPKRRYWLDAFAHGARIAPVQSIARLPPRTRLGYKLRRLHPPIGKPLLSVVSERSTNEFEPRFLAAPRNTYLVGHWPSERYFADHAATIRSDLAFAHEPSAENRVVAEQIRSSASVSVHVRRGDFITDPGPFERYVHLDNDYYRSALDLVTRDAGPVTAYVFSDEPAWCTEHLDLPCPKVVVDVNGPGTASEDLRLMALCDHHVVANSTFSWWGAWLDPRASSVVVAPEYWQHGEPIPERYPEGWLIVPVKPRR